jgi:hypothetical protein
LPCSTSAVYLMCQSGILYKWTNLKSAFLIYCISKHSIKLSLFTDTSFGTTLVRNVSIYRSTRCNIPKDFWLHSYARIDPTDACMSPCYGLVYFRHLVIFLLSSSRSGSRDGLPCPAAVPPTPQLICPQVVTACLFLCWATSLPPQTQLVVILTAGPTQSGPSTAFLFRNVLTTLCQLYRLCNVQKKDECKWNEDRQRTARGSEGKRHLVSEPKL